MSQASPRLLPLAVLGSCLLAGAAMAAPPAKKKPAPAPAAEAPAEAPAAPAAAPAPGGTDQGGSGKLALIPTQNDWTKVCNPDPTANKKICYTTRDFSAAANQPPVLALAVYDIPGDDTRVIRMLMPVGLMLRPGFRFAVDNGPSNDGAFEICFPNGCFAESKVKGAIVDSMKKATALNVSVRNSKNEQVDFAIPLTGFGKAFDGAPIDPKVLEEQQKKLQAELQKRAEDERKKLESQQPGAASPTGGATMTPPAGK
jgi:invasion protein IalB